MLCLQQALVPYVNAGTGSCTGLTNLAISSHVACYLDNGVCALPASDLAKIFGTVWQGLLSLAEPVFLTRFAF